MSTIRLDLFDLENTSGNPTLVWVSNEGGMNGGLRTDFRMKFSNPLEIYSIPILMRGIGSGISGLSGDNALIDPYLEFSINEQSGSNEHWTGLSNYTQISGYDLQPPNFTDPASIRTVYYGEQYATIKGSGGELVYDKHAQLDLIRVFQDDFKDYRYTSSGQSGAWISYDVTTGSNNKKVFAFSLEILQSVSGITGDQLVSGSPETNFTQEQYKPSRLVSYSGYRYSGYCNDVSLLIDDTGVNCVVDIPSIQRDADSPLEVCIPSGLSPAAVSVIINQALTNYRRTESAKGRFEGDPIDDSQVGTTSAGASYDIYQGIIEYNEPYSGDSFTFNPYFYDYTGTYNGRYGIDPPYPSSGFTFYFPQDYTGITGLVDRINQTLSGSGYQLWAKDLCSDTNNSGYFETGGLMRAYTGDSNTILIESIRVGTMGKYSLSFTSAPRPASINYSNNTLENTIKYLLPNVVKIQGANTYGDWSDIYAKTGVNWGQIVPQKVRQVFQESYTGYFTGSNGSIAPDSSITGSETDLEGFVATGAAVRNLIYQGGVSGFNKCGNPFNVAINFYEVPTGFDCNGALEESGINLNGAGESSGLFVSGQTRIVDYYFLKTGWKFDNQNEYNYYRIYLDEFRNDGAAQQLEQTFVINGINLYGYETGIPIHTGEMCLLGATYTGQIMGLTSGTLSGTLTGVADASGKLCYNRFQVVGAPNDGGMVRFQNTSGNPTTPFTGLVIACGTGTGFYLADVEGYYYNPDSQCVEFSKPVSGYITGSGQLTGGPYNIIFDEVASGITGTQTVSGSGYGYLTGVIPDFNYVFGDLNAFGYVTGLVTGLATVGNSGTVVISQIITQTPATGYSFVISGTTEATSVLNYNSPASGDRIFINDFVVIYNPNTGLQAPTYFKTINELTNIINSGSGSFLATGSNDGSKIYLTSILLGDSGNVIRTISSGSTGVPTFGATGFTGGYTQYTVINPTGSFTGLLEMTLYGSGVYTGQGTGTMSGTIKQLDFIRYFTGIWNIGSGLLNFRSLNYVTGGSRYQNSGFQTMDILSGQPSVVPFFISYLNSPIVASNDLARLTITGIGAGTGVTMILSGQM